MDRINSRNGLQTLVNDYYRVDQYSPKHLADRFNQLFDKEWKSAYLESTAKTKDETVLTLLQIVMVG